MSAGDNGLVVAPAFAAPNRIDDVDDSVADLMKATSVLGRRAVVDSLAIRVQLPTPLTMMVAVEAEV